MAFGVFAVNKDVTPKGTKVRLSSPNCYFAHLCRTFKAYCSL